MIIDFHTHYLAREHLQMHAKTPDGRIVGSSMRGQGKDAVMETNGVPLGSSCKPEDFYDLAARLEFMSATSVDIEVLSPPPFMSFTDIAGPEAAKLVREQNEAIAEVVRQYPDSFRGLGMAPLQDADSAVTEIAYLMDTLRLAGVEILTHIAGKNLDSSDLDPVRRIQVLACNVREDLHACQPQGIHEVGNFRHSTIRILQWSHAKTSERIRILADHLSDGLVLFPYQFGCFWPCYISERHKRRRRKHFDIHTSGRHELKTRSKIVEILRLTGTSQWDTICLHNGVFALSAHA